ncbi:MAG: nucleotidyltransferase domain-containing protein [Candidatus Magasanikbacteria bacterium]
MTQKTKQPKTKEEFINEVVEKIKKEYSPEQIILFGSYAWGEPNEDSDIDLFIVKETENPRELARKVDGSIYPRKHPLDIMLWTPKQIKEQRKSGNFFVEDVFDRGKKLYEKQ